MKTTVISSASASKILTMAFSFLFFILFTLSSTAQLRKIENNAFQKGEKLVYKMYYDSFVTGPVIAGECVFEIQKKGRVVAQRNTMHIIVNGYTKGAFNLFFKVRDRYETFLDEEAMIPWLFIRRVDEGGVTIKQDVHFNQYYTIYQSSAQQDKCQQHPCQYPGYSICNLLLQNTGFFKSKTRRGISCCFYS